MKKKKQKVQMPAGIRQKLMAAVSMLMVSIIMLVSSTYAWFTLSTAPEVTGISTSVGANGNLEMALLNGTADGTSKTDTYADTKRITSQVGDSSSAANKTAKQANITWGNLVDLSDGSYGLNSIKLYPATLNIADTTEGVTYDTATKLNQAIPLSTPVYGADGRVTEVTANTASAVYNTDKFTVGDKQSYGVRAIGTSAGVSARYMVFNGAKNVVVSGLTGSGSRTKGAINANLSTFMTLAMAAEDTKALPDSYKREEIVGIQAVANGMKADLNTIVSIYRNAAVAELAADTQNADADFATEKANLDKMSDTAFLTSIKTKYPEAGNIQTAITDVQSALDKFAEVLKDNDVTTFQGTNVNGAIGKLLGDSLQHTTVSKENTKNIYLTGGALNVISVQVGTFEIASVGPMHVYGGAEGKEADLNTVKSAVNALKAPGATSTEKNITDTYGYILDFAFRTNATGSKLQLQTTPKNRVYDGAPGTDLATQGSGSTVTFTYPDEGDKLNVDQVNKLLGAVRIIFFNPVDGTIYAKASLTNITSDAAKATANVKIKDQEGDVGTITALTQNEVAKVSVMVYLEGADIDNTAVTNAVSSGKLDLNLQFSSSATLNPMENSALKTMTKTPTQQP